MSIDATGDWIAYEASTLSENPIVSEGTFIVHGGLTWRVPNSARFADPCGVEPPEVSAPQIAGYAVGDAEQPTRNATSLSE